MILKILDKLIKPETRKNKEVYRNNQLFIQTGLICSFFSLFYSIYDRLIGFSFNSAVNIFSIGGSIIILAYYFTTNKYRTSALMVSIFALIMDWLCIYSTGGYISPLIPWIIISPIFAFLFLNRKAGVFFSVLMFFSIGLLYFLHKLGIKPYFDFQVTNNHTFYILSYSGFLIMVLSIIFIIYDRGLKDYIDFQERTKQIADDKFSELKEKNAELAEANTHFEQIFNIIPDPVLISRLSDGLFIDCNESYYKNTGYTKEDFAGKTTLDIQIWINPEDRKAIVNMLKEKGYCNNYEALFRSKDGRIITRLFSAKIMLIHGVSCILSVTHDITERKQAETELIKSENKYRNLFNNATVGMFRTKLDGSEILDFNDEFIKIFGYSRDEMLGKPTVIYWADQTEREAMVKRLTDEVRVSDFEVRMVNKKGGIRHCLISLRLYKDEGILEGSLKDVTESKLLVEALKDSEYFFKESQNVAYIGSYKTDFVKGFWESSEVLDNIFGIEKDYVRSVDGWLDIIHPDDRQMMNDYLLKEVIGRRIKFDKEYRIVRQKDKQERWVHGLGETKFDESGKIISMLGTIQDITDRKLLEQQLIIEKERAEESDKLKSTFLANMSHEIRTPMNSIIGFAGLLKDQEISQENKKQYLDVLEASSNHLLNLIDDLIEISKIEIGELKLKMEETNLNEFILNLHNEFKIKNKNELLEIKCITNAANNGLYILTDNNRLRQVFNNLLNNAYKFTNKGFIEFGYNIKEAGSSKLEIRNKSSIQYPASSFQFPYIEFYVKDTGIGINEQDKEIIFDSFRQVENVNTKKYKGTGLGLAISKKIIEAMGGQISVETEPEKGSNFIFTLPYKPVTKKRKDYVSKESSKTKMIPDLKNKKILIADDDEFNFMLLEIMVAKTNANILRAKDGNECIDIFKNNNDIDLVLLDIQMPGKSGTDVVKIIKQIRKDIPVIAQTAYAMSGDKDKILEAGCDNYISKPIDDKKIMMMLSEYLA